MADIAKLQGLGIEGLAKAWGTDITSLAKIIGLDVPSGGLTTITAEDSELFEGGEVGDVSVCMMTSTVAIVTYADGGFEYYGTARVLTLSGGVITAGEPVIFESAAIHFSSVCRMTSTVAIVTYRDGGNSGYGTACALSVSGTIVTVGTPIVFESANTWYCSVCMMTSTIAIVTYSDLGNNYYGTARALSLSGTTITTPSVAVVFESADVHQTITCLMSSTVAIVVYRDGGNSGYGTACALSISGTSITAGDPVVFESASVEDTIVCMMTSAIAIVAYRNNGYSGYGTARALSLSGTTITTPSAAVVFESAETRNISVCMMTSNTAIVVYSDLENDGYGTACALSRSGTAITAGTPVVFESWETSYISVCMMTDTTAIVTYQYAFIDEWDEWNNQNYGAACVLTLS